jgi:hypothetical protein
LLQHTHFVHPMTPANPFRDNRYRGNGEILRREEFEARKEAAEIARQQKANKKPKKLASAGKELDDFPLLKVRVREKLLCAFFFPKCHQDVSDIFSPSLLSVCLFMSLHSGVGSKGRGSEERQVDDDHIH